MIEEIDYNVLVENALKNVIKEALQITLKQGLPGENHFYITFKTTHPNASVPASIREQHPEEMTIVMQHQFLDLDVQDDFFAVTLGFNGINHRLTVPYESIVSFADPFATFGLQFSHSQAGGANTSDASIRKTTLKAVDDDSFDDEADEDFSAISTEAAETSTYTSEQAIDDAEEDGNNVVVLDAFRKKNV